MGRGNHVITKTKLKKGRKSYPQTVPDEVFNAWQKFKRIGDNKKVAELIGKSEPTALRALNFGFLKEMDKMEEINTFFAERHKREMKKSEELIQLANDKK